MPKRLYSDISEFLVMEISEQVRALVRGGKDVIRMHIGAPDFDMPEPVKEAAVKAIMDGMSNYTSCLGLLSLRESICKYYYSGPHCQDSFLLKLSVNIG